MGGQNIKDCLTSYMKDPLTLTSLVKQGHLTFYRPPYMSTGGMKGLKGYPPPIVILKKGKRNLLPLKIFPAQPAK